MDYQKRVEELSGMKVEALRKMARKVRIKNVNSYRKAGLVEKIASVEHMEYLEADGQQEFEEKRADSPKVSYIINASIGQLVAFKLPNGKVKSAKIINRSSKQRKLKVQTDYKAVFVIGYDDVIWVRTGKRWPNGVYQLLKGIKKYSDSSHMA